MRRVSTFYKDAREEIFSKIRGMVRTTSQAVLIERMSFDEETSLDFDPEAQRRWLDRVEEQLSETAPQIKSQHKKSY